MDGSGNIDAATAASSGELLSFVERLEHLRAEQADLKAQEKEIFAEIKGRGYMTRPIRTILKERATDPDKLAEEQAVLDLYRAAIGRP